MLEGPNNPNGGPYPDASTCDNNIYLERSKPHEDPEVVYIQFAS